MYSLARALACAGILASTASAGLTPLEVQGQEFVVSGTTKRFQIIGIDYQPGGSAAYGTGEGDPLSNPTACLRDAALMQQLGINTIRVYNANPALDHNECVSIFDSVGIYMLIDVNSPLAGQSLDNDDPSGSYTLSYLNHIFEVVENFAGYSNLIGFFAGNEVINDVANAETCPPYIRAVQRDLKDYIAAHATRAIPVGYSAADVDTLYYDTLAYLMCDITSGSGVNSSSDFYGLNSYSWCGNGSSFDISGYDIIVDEFSNSTIPTFFSEYGCNVPSPRYFQETPVLYGPLMADMSGGLVYQWTQDVSNYGLVSVYSNQTAQLLFDYYTLADQLATVDVSDIETVNATATALVSAPICAASLITGGDFSTDFDIPDPPAGAAALISAGVTGITPGSLVAVTKTSVSVAVYNTAGVRLSDLKITTGVADAASHLGQVATATSASGSSAPSAAASSSTAASGSGTSSTSKSGAAATARPVPAGVVANGAAVAALGLAALLL